MFRSMTGFGRDQVRTDRYAVRTEVRSVNNRSLHITFRLPDTLLALERDLDKQVRNAVTRGTVYVTVNSDELTGETGYVLDPLAIKAYRETLTGLRDEIGLSGDPSLDLLVGLPGVVRRSAVAEEIPDELSYMVRQGLKSALEELTRTRAEEGAAIQRDILARCETISTQVKSVEKMLPRMLEDYRKRLSDRLATLLERVGSSLTEEDMRREVVIFAERSDIAEEITRLRSHLDRMGEMTSSEEPCGRKLEFISQEMLREANTMASKAGDADIVQQVVEIKAEIEKIREQALNVE